MKHFSTQASNQNFESDSYASHRQCQSATVGAYQHKHTLNLESWLNLAHFKGHILYMPLALSAFESVYENSTRLYQVLKPTDSAETKP